MKVRSSVADPVHFFPIRGLFAHKGSGSGIFPDPGDPKKTGTGSATLVRSNSNVGVNVRKRLK